MDHLEVNHLKFKLLHPRYIYIYIYDISLCMLSSDTSTLASNIITSIVKWFPPLGPEAYSCPLDRGKIFFGSFQRRLVRGLNDHHHPFTRSMLLKILHFTNAFIIVKLILDYLFSHVEQCWSEGPSCLQPRPLGNRVAPLSSMCY